MRKIIQLVAASAALFLIISCASTPTQQPAQQAEQPQQPAPMTQAQQDKYNSMAITLLPTGLPLDSQEWWVDEGYNRIDEFSFLRLAGDKADAAAAYKYHRRNTVMQILGWVAAVGGFAYSFYGAFSQNNSETFDVTPILVGVGACLGGTAVGVIYLMKPPDLFPLGKAQQIARDYNQQLLEKINSSKAP
jgi:hypothetical protein